MRDAARPPRAPPQRAAAVYRFLRGTVSVLRDWPHQRLWDLARILRPRRAVRGTHLIEQGSPLRDQPVCFLRAGQCRVERTIGLPRTFPPTGTEANATIPLAMLFPGDVFGEQACAPTY